MRHHHIADIPGDGIGQEVIPAGIEVLTALAERQGYKTAGIYNAAAAG